MNAVREDTKKRSSSNADSSFTKNNSTYKLDTSEKKLGKTRRSDDFILKEALKTQKKILESLEEEK